MRERWKSFTTLLQLTLRASPLAASIELTLVLVIAIASPLQAWAAASMVDAISGDGAVLTSGVALIITIVVVLIGQAAVDAARHRMEDAVELALQTETMDLAMAPRGISHHETPAVADRLNAISEEFRRLKGTAGTIGGGLTVLAGTATTLVLLAGVHPLLLLLPLVGGLRLWASAAGARNFRHAITSTMVHYRRHTRLLEAASDADHGLEVRCYGIRGLIVDRIGSLFGLQNTPRWQVQASTGRLEILSRVAFGLAYGAAILLVLWRARQGQATAGDVALVLLLAPQTDQAAHRLSESVRALVAMLDVTDNIRYLRGFVAKQLRPEDGDSDSGDTRTPGPSATPHEMLGNGIDLQDVSFSYPGQGPAVLRGVSAFLPAGRTVALVGENGAGKTTLVKLLARLYEPTSGRITVDGADLQNVDYDGWSARISVGFQDFVRYEYTAREAIGLGEPGVLDDDLAAQEQYRAAIEAGDAQAVIERLEDGLDTRLGVRFGGTELSGGQWQRLALARAFMRESPLLVLLDEPAAALDPETEHALFERFDAARSAAREVGGITLLVSHRLSTVRMADLILVFQDGELVESGGHTELVERGGTYSDLYSLQAKAYQ